MEVSDFWEEEGFNLPDKLQKNFPREGGQPKISGLRGGQTPRNPSATSMITDYSYLRSSEDLGVDP